MSILAALALVAAQQSYPGAVYHLPDGTPVQAPALPPEQFRGDVDVTVLFVNPIMVRPWCDGLPAIACTRYDDKSLVLPNPCDPKYEHDTYAVIACHEKGHILGWQHD